MDKFELRIPRLYVDFHLSQALRRPNEGRDGIHRTRFPLGVSEVRSQCFQLLARNPTQAGFPPQLEGSQLQLVSGEYYRDLEREERAWRAQDHSPGFYQALVTLGIGPRLTGRVKGLARAPGSPVSALSSLSIPGGGMLRLQLAGEARKSVPLDLERWSRTADALGEGVLQRLCEIRFAIIGAGRNGSLLAASLAGMGIRSLTLVDPDRVERHNLGESVGLQEGDVGQPKTTALKARLAVEYPWASVRALHAPVSAWPALRAVKESDLVIACPDNEPARMVTGALAAVYGRPLLDFGSGVLLEAEGVTMGTELRLILPGDGCILCWAGGPVDLVAVHQNLSGGQDIPARRDGDWQAERAGSLRSVNTTAVGLAMRLLEDLMLGRVRSSTWMQLIWGQDGLPNVQHRLHTPVPFSRTCFCALAGLGDEGIGRLQRWIRNPSSQLG